MHLTTQQEETREAILGHRNHLQKQLLSHTNSVRKLATAVNQLALAADLSDSVRQETRKKLLAELDRIAPPSASSSAPPSSASTPSSPSSAPPTP